MKGNLSARADNGRINSSPTTAVFPVYRLRHDATHTITIPGKEGSIANTTIYTVLEDVLGTSLLFTRARHYHSRCNSLFAVP